MGPKSHKFSWSLLTRHLYTRQLVYQTRSVQAIPGLGPGSLHFYPGFLPGYEKLNPGKMDSSLDPVYMQAGAFTVLPIVLSISSKEKMLVLTQLQRCRAVEL